MRRWPDLEHSLDGRKETVLRHAIRALMVTSDSALLTTFAEISKEIGIEAQASVARRGIPEELSDAKYEAVLLDFDTVPEAMPILAAVRQSHSNENAVVFAVASDAAQGQAVLEKGANVVVERPVEPKRIRRALYAGYDLMVRERRRYFRCAVELPVLLIQSGSGADFRCSSINVSRNGIAVSTPSAFKPGEEVQVVFLLPNTGLIIRALGAVVWDDKHGKTGVSFKCGNPQHQNDLDAWLDARLHEYLDKVHSGRKYSRSAARKES